MLWFSLLLCTQRTHNIYFNLSINSFIASKFNREWRWEVFCSLWSRMEEVNELRHWTDTVGLVFEQLQLVNASQVGRHLLAEWDANLGWHEADPHPAVQRFGQWPNQLLSSNYKQTNNISRTKWKRKIKMVQYGICLCSDLCTLACSSYYPSTTIYTTSYSTPYSCTGFKNRLLNVSVSAGKSCVLLFFTLGTRCVRADLAIYSTL